MRSPNLAVDQLIYTAREVENIHPWMDDTLGAEGVGERFDVELDALADAVRAMRTALYRWHHYSDGRPVLIAGDVEPGHTFVYIVRPIPEHPGERHLCSGTLAPAWPGERDRGHYDVYVDDVAATIRIERSAPLALVELVDQ